MNLEGSTGVIAKLNEVNSLIQFAVGEYDEVTVESGHATVGIAPNHFNGSAYQLESFGFWIDWVNGRCTSGADQGYAAMSQSDSYKGNAVVSSRGGETVMVDGFGKSNDQVYAAAADQISEAVDVHIKFTSCFIIIMKEDASHYTLYIEYIHLCSMLPGQTGVAYTYQPSVRKAVAVANSGPGLYRIMASHEDPFYSPDHGGDEILLPLEDGWFQACGLSVNTKPVQSEFGFSFVGASLVEDGVCSEITEDGRLKLQLPVAVSGLLPTLYDYPAYLGELNVDVDGDSTTSVLLKDQNGHEYAAALHATPALQEKLENGSSPQINPDMLLVINSPANASITNRKVRELLEDGTLSGEFADWLREQIEQLD